MTKVEVSRSLGESWFASSIRSEIFKEKHLLGSSVSVNFQVMRRTELEKSTCERLLQKLGVFEGLFLVRLPFLGGNCPGGGIVLFSLALGQLPPGQFPPGQLPSMPITPQTITPWTVIPYANCAPDNYPRDNSPLCQLSPGQSPPPHPSIADPPEASWLS